MKKITLLLGLLVASISALFAQVPMATEDVMLQAFYWNSHGETKWSQLNSQASEIAASFDLVWLPPASSAEFGGDYNMGYHPYQWSNLSSSWGDRSQLTTLIKSLHNGNCKVIADIVVNHRAGNSPQGNFPTDNFGDYGSYTIPNSCITKDDEKATSAATDNDYKWNVSGDMWGGYSAARDLAHSKSEVREAIKAYLKWLKNNIGFDGFRYDLVKGYDPKYTAEYNTASAPYFSVGEFYQSKYDYLAGWVNGTSKKSTVFDFCFKQAMYDWGGGTDYSKLVWKDGNIDRPAGLIHNPGMRQYAVTFIDNHDTAEPHKDAWELKNNIEQANAVMLSAPGIPCVFWKHWTKHKSAIKQMIATRKAMGVNSNSDVKVTNKSGYYESVATGTKGTLICRIGSWSGTPDGYTVACNGNGWAYYTSKSVNPNPNPTPDPTPGPTPDPTPDPTPGGTGYSLYVNGKDLYNMTDEGAWDIDNSYNQFALPNVSLKAGDTFVFYNNATGETWGNVTVDPASIAGISGTGTNFSVSSDGCYSIYLKLKWQSDNVYFGEGKDCSAAPTPTPTPDPDPTPGPTPTPDPTPGLSTDYYLIGYINGADYASGETDWTITGDYKFVNGKVTITFTETSYVYVKTGDLSNWFMAHEYVMPNESGASGTLYSTSNDPLALEKIGVPAGTVTFTLVENTDGSITLSYTMGASAIVEAESVNMTIYPNPTSDFITINCDEVIDEVVISALNGSEVIRTKSNEIDLSSLTPSMYFVNVMLQNGDVVRSKVIRK